MDETGLRSCLASQSHREERQWIKANRPEYGPSGATDLLFILLGALEILRRQALTVLDMKDNN